MNDFASHYARLPDDELLRLTSDMASLLPGAREALKTEAQKRNLSTESIDWNAQPPALPVTLPYSWGKFQGWMMLICGVFAFFVMLGKGDIFGIVAAIFSAYTGYALVKRKRHGVFLFFIVAALSSLYVLFIDFGAVVGLFASTPEKAGYALGQALIFTLFCVGYWVIPAVDYYPKRLAEFRKPAGEV